MPSKSAKQRRFMAMSCKRPETAKQHISRKVACEYFRADKKRASRH